MVQVFDRSAGHQADRETGVMSRVVKGRQPRFDARVEVHSSKLMTGCSGEGLKALRGGVWLV